MAVKEDKFREEHKPVYSEAEALKEKVGVEGIVAEEVSDWKRWGAVMFVGIPICAVAIIGIFDSEVGWVEALAAIIVLIAIGMTLEAFLQSFRRRYRLAVGGVLDGQFLSHCRRPHALLQHVLSTPALYTQLGPPQAGELATYIHPGRSDIWYWLIVPSYVLVVCFAFIGMLLYMSSKPVLLLVFVLVHLFRAWRMRTRVKAGVRAFGTGQEESADETPLRRFEAVQRAELRWDALLQQSYLLLGIGDEETRYYSPTDDALYLARLVKHRLPEGVLRLHEGNPAAPPNV